MASIAFFFTVWANTATRRTIEYLSWVWTLVGNIRTLTPTRYLVEVLSFGTRWFRIWTLALARLSVESLVSRAFLYDRAHTFTIFIVVYLNRVGTF